MKLWFGFLEYDKVDGQMSSQSQLFAGSVETEMCSKGTGIHANEEGISLWWHIYTYVFIDIK
jgi:hypothetical protein